MNPTFYFGVLLGIAVLTQGRPQIPDGFGDVITAIGETASELIR